MNAQERAKALYVKLFIDGTDEDHQTVLFNALAQVEAETWEQAAKMIIMPDGWDFRPVERAQIMAVIEDIRDIIRQQAQRAKQRLPD